MPVAAAPPDYQLPVPFKKTTPGYKVSRFCRGTSPPEETVPSNIHQPSQDLRQVKTLDLNPWLKSARNRNFGTIANIASTIVLFFVAALTGCGGGKFNPTPSCTTTGFDNQTNGGATDSQLQALWQQAQRDLATQPITLNPVTVQMQGGTIETIAPDSRANGVQPQ